MIPPELVRSIVEEQIIKIQERVKPAEVILTSEFAERHRYLSPEDSEKAAQGDPKWSHDGFEYLIEFQNCFDDPDIREISVMKSGQIGFTQAMLNMIAKIIVMHPGPVLIIYPTDSNARKFSKRKLEPMIRDTPILKGKISDNLKDGDNSILEKSFPGGFLSIVSGSSVNNLSAQSIKYLFIDEKDRIKRTAGIEGDTVEIVKKRQMGFNETYKRINISTPTLKWSSRIYEDYIRSDKRKYHVPCLFCNEFIELSFWQLKGWRIAKGVYEPANCYYECQKCNNKMYERDKYLLRKNGRWIKDAPEVTTHAGFHINEMISSIKPWSELIGDFITKKNNPDKLQTFFNLELGEVFEDIQTEAPSQNELMNRAEEYSINCIPRGVLVLIASADVQGDRIEAKIKGYGKYEESWLLAVEKFYGDTQTPYAQNQSNVYYQLEQFLDKDFLHESGVRLRITAAGIDSGFATSYVQRFVKAMHRKNKKWIFSLKGDKGEAGAPILSRPSVNNKLGVKQFTVGTATAKRLIYYRLNIDKFGPGYMHYPKDAKNINEEYFEQLTSEKEIPVYERGIMVRKRWIKTQARNEGLDMEVYCLAGLEYANIQNWDALEERMQELEQKIIEEKKQSDETNEDNEQTKDLRKFRKKIIHSSSNYVMG